MITFWNALEFLERDGIMQSNTTGAHFVIVSTIPRNVKDISQELLGCSHSDVGNVFIQDRVEGCAAMFYLTVNNYRL